QDRQPEEAPFGAYVGHKPFVQSQWPQELGDLATHGTHHAPARFVACSARRITAVAEAQSWSVRRARSTAAAPSIVQAAQARSNAAPVERVANTRARATPPEEHRGSERNRTSCLPAPCSSMTMRNRLDPSIPPRTSRSQRSKSPPRRTGAPSARSRASRERSHSECARQPSLQM